MIEAIKITSSQDQETARKIREEVFVKEQNVPLEEEYDQYEAESTHFLAFYYKNACGTARRRFKNAVFARTSTSSRFL